MWKALALALTYGGHWGKPRASGFRIAGVRSWFVPAVSWTQVDCITAGAILRGFTRTTTSRQLSVICNLHYVLLLFIPAKQDWLISSTFWVHFTYSTQGQYYLFWRYSYGRPDPQIKKCFQLVILDMFDVASSQNVSSFSVMICVDLGYSV